MKLTKSLIKADIIAARQAIEYIDDHLNRITDWEAGSRYDYSFSIRIDTLKKCYEIIAGWEKLI